MFNMKTLIRVKEKVTVAISHKPWMGRPEWRLLSETRREHIHVGLGPASLRATVSERSRHSGLPDTGFSFAGKTWLGRIFSGDAQ